MSDQSPKPTRSGSQRTERRKHRRAKAEWSAHIAVEQGFTEVQLRDISAAGACFFSDRPLPVLTVLGLHIDLPGTDGGEPLSVDSKGVVVRSEKISPHLEHYEVAVFLNELTDDQRAAITAYVARRVEAGDEV